MPIYIFLGKLTDEGRKNIKQIPADIQKGNKNVEKMGGKVIGVYGVMGEYDSVAIAEFPSDEAASAFVLYPEPSGNVWYRTVTMRAFSMEEFSGIINKLP